jgi:hypothetical protein
VVTAILLALEALPDASDEAARPYVPQAELELERAWRHMREQFAHTHPQNRRTTPQCPTI